MARIVVADDDSNVRTLVRIALQRAGHEVREASNGKETVHLIRRDPPDFLIADILMPVKEGIETIIEVRRQFPRVKIIAMSGGGLIDAEEYLDTASEFGADKTIHKPFDQATILKAVDELSSDRRRW